MSTTLTTINKETDSLKVSDLLFFHNVFCRGDSFRLINHNSLDENRVSLYSVLHFTFSDMFPFTSLVDEGKVKLRPIYTLKLDAIRSKYYYEQRTNIIFATETGKIIKINQDKLTQSEKDFINMFESLFLLKLKTINDY